MYIQRGNSYIPMDGGQLCESMPAGIYSIEYGMGGFSLTRTNDFILPSRIYGNIEAYANRILTTFTDRPGSTGVILAGESGAGKSMLGKLVAMKALERGIMTILVTQCYRGDEFNAFMNSIQQPALIFLDEYEKVFDGYDQEQMLTLFDGVCNSKKLYIITCNNIEAIDSHMINRPGRMYYNLAFAGISAALIREYCASELVNQRYVDEIVQLSAEIENFSFDMLKAIVEEMNRYEESPRQALVMLNIGDIMSIGLVINNIALSAAVGLTVGMLAFAAFICLIETRIGHAILIGLVCWITGAMILSILTSIFHVTYLWNNNVVVIFIPLVIGGAILWFIFRGYHDNTD